MQVEDRALALLVGGDDALRAMLTFLLTDCGWHVVSDDADAAAARSPRLSWPPVSVLVAVDDGAATHDVSTLDALRRRAGIAPVLLLARRPDREVRRRAALAGVARVLALPAHPRDLRAQFQSLLPPSTPIPATVDGAPAPLIRAGGVVLDTNARALHRERAGREPVRLTRHEAAVLAAL